MLNDLESVMFDEKALAKRVSELGQEISKDYKGKDVLMVGIMKGAVVFFSDLIRQVNLPLGIDFIIASSYGDGTESSGSVNIKKDLENDIKGKHVILVEDIIDSGITMKHLMEILWKREPASIRLCALLSKESRRQVPVKIDYCGFDVPDEFLVGYGLDYAEKYRNLPVIGVLKREIYM
ncbi:MAG: hypoxanthine phosphoribosyltransferase [Anaerovibrio sp.]|uniref:hypoxanthine phosphoribosyltransferase n=1 Tax=Anaerovibrio sp. TaxID=1872532 RepID=UPI002600ACE3|nr:hypoxanthine phosphoribosyltransferase [Anaerovibrio sp.]MCR5176597.1 hypoxanthine phosphoribosyltransferase [Anaerovibrio sp.]